MVLTEDLVFIGRDETGTERQLQFTAGTSCPAVDMRSSEPGAKAIVAIIESRRRRGEEWQAVLLGGLPRAVPKSSVGLTAGTLGAGGPSKESTAVTHPLRDMSEYSTASPAPNVPAGQCPASFGIVVIVDFLNLLVRAFHAGQPSDVHAVRGLLDTVRIMLERLSPEYLLFAADGGYIARDPGGSIIPAPFGPLSWDGQFPLLAHFFNGFFSGLPDRLQPPEFQAALAQTAR